MISRKRACYRNCYSYYNKISMGFYLTMHKNEIGKRNINHFLIENYSVVLFVFVLCLIRFIQCRIIIKEKNYSLLYFFFLVFNYLQSPGKLNFTIGFFKVTKE